MKILPHENSFYTFSVCNVTEGTSRVTQVHFKFTHELILHELSLGGTFLQLLESGVRAKIQTSALKTVSHSTCKTSLERTGHLNPSQEGEKTGLTDQLYCRFTLGFICRKNLNQIFLYCSVFNQRFTDSFTIVCIHYSRYVLFFLHIF